MHDLSRPQRAAVGILPLLKKLRGQKASLFCVFVFRLGGVRGVSYEFSGLPSREIAFVFDLAAAVQEDNAATLSLICVPLASRGRVGERAADPLYRAGIDAKALADAAYTFTSALALIQGCLDSFLKLGGYPRPAKYAPTVLRNC